MSRSIQALLRLCAGLAAAVALICLTTVIAFAASATDVYPPGIDGPKSLFGLYSGTDAGSCCWLDGSASLEVHVPPHARAMNLRILIPDYTLKNGEQQHITAQVDREPPHATCCLHAGFHELLVPLPANHAATVMLALQMSHTFVPQNAGLGPDERSLSVLLEGVEFAPENATPLQLFFFIAVAIAVMFTTYRRPALALAWILLSAPCAALIVIGSATVTVPQAVLLGAALGLLARSRFRMPAVDKPTAIFIGLQVLLFVVMSLSTLGARYKAPAILELWKAFQYIATFAIAWAAVRADPDDRYPRWALAALTLIVSALAAFQEFSGAPTTEVVLGHIVARIAGPLDGPNQLGAFLGLCVPVLAAYALGARRAYFEAAAAIAGTVVLVLTLSRGSWIALAVAALIIVCARYRPAARGMVLRILAGTFALFFFWALLQFAQVAPHGGSAFNGGLGSRPELWRDANLLWRTSPVLGIGPGNYELRLAEVGSIGVRTHANSAYFQSLVETGIVGFLLFATTLWFTLKRLAAVNASVLIVGILAAVAGLAFHQIVDVLTFYPKVGVLYWAVLAWGFAAASRGASTSSA